MSEDSRPHRYGWPEYEKLVLSSLKRVESEIEQIKDKLHELLADDLGRLKTDIALLKFQAGLYGALAGFVITSILTAVFQLLIFKK